MTADIDAVLSRLRERPECRDAVEVIERLTAERDRLREALTLMRDWCLNGEEPDGHGDLIAYANRLLGESPVPDGPTCRNCGKPIVPFGDDGTWTHDGDLVLGMNCGLFAAPAHPTGEERNR